MLAEPTHSPKEWIYRCCHCKIDDRVSSLCSICTMHSQVQTHLIFFVFSSLCCTTNKCHSDDKFYEQLSFTSFHRQKHKHKVYEKSFLLNLSISHPLFQTKQKHQQTHSFVSSHNRYQPDACHNKMFCFMFGHIPFYAFIFLVFLPFGISTSSRREKPHKNACGCFIEKLPNCNRSPSRNGDKRTTRNNLHCLSLYCSVYTMNTIQKL